MPYQDIVHPSSQNVINVIAAPVFPRDPMVELERKLFDTTRDTGAKIKISNAAALTFSPDVTTNERSFVFLGLLKEQVKSKEGMVGSLMDLDRWKQGIGKMPEGSEIEIGQLSVDVKKDEAGRLVLIGRVPGMREYQKQIAKLDEKEGQRELQDFANTMYAYQLGMSEKLNELSVNIGIGSSLSGQDGVVKLDMTRSIDPKAKQELSAAIGTGVMRFIVEKINGQVGVVNLYSEDLENLAHPIVVNGRIMNTTFQKSAKVNTGLVVAESCSKTAATSLYRQPSFGSTIPRDSLDISITCADEPAVSKKAGKAPYVIPIEGLDKFRAGELFSHEPYSPIKGASRIISPDGNTTISPGEREMVEAAFDGGAEIESLFGFRKRQLGKYLTLIPSNGGGPHVAENDPFSIRIEEDKFLRMSKDSAKAMGRHELIHILNLRFHITDHEESKVAAFWQKMKKTGEVGERFFARINESSSYLIVGGHAQENESELMSSGINYMLHPRYKDLIARESSEFRSRFTEFLEAARDDLKFAGLGSAGSGVRRVEASIQLAKDTKRRGVIDEEL